MVDDEFRRNWKYAMKHMPVLVSILKEHANLFINIKVTPFDKDTQEATDLVMKVDGGDIACRVRRPNCTFRDLTIRAWRKGVDRTEIHKIREGFARWYIYAWTKGEHISEWMIIDLDKMREIGLIYEDRMLIRTDDRTKFFAYPRKELRDKGCIVAEDLDYEYANPSAF